MNRDLVLLRASYITIYHSHETTGLLEATATNDIHTIANSGANKNIHMWYNATLWWSDFRKSSAGVNSYLRFRIYIYAAPKLCNAAAACARVLESPQVEKDWVKRISTTMKCGHGRRISPATNRWLNAAQVCCACSNEHYKGKRLLRK